MIVLDTNVVSEPMRSGGGHPAVRSWLDRQVAETLFLTATNLSELLMRIEILPDGKRKQGLASALSDLLQRLFESRVLPFDDRAARIYASLVGRARAAGHTLSVADGQIAAIAELHGFTMATRDTDTFIAAGVAVINPWEVPD